MPPSVPDLGPQAERNSPRSAIANAVVRLHAKYYGRGPTKARTHFHADFVLVVLEEIFTPAERTLVNAGNTEQVEAMRDAFQEVMREEFIEAVESISGRTVRAFISSVSIEPELATELFLFEPEQHDEPLET